MGYLEFCSLECACVIVLFLLFVCQMQLLSYTLQMINIEVFNTLHCVTVCGVDGRTLSVEVSSIRIWMDEP
jgi:hypothetical protein